MGAPTLTALVIEPAEAIQTQLRGLLADRGYRVVPVNSSDEGLGLGAAPALRRHLLLGSRAGAQLGGNRGTGEDSRGRIRAAFRFL
jgi:hypothetical protein